MKDARDGGQGRESKKAKGSDVKERRWRIEEEEEEVDCEYSPEI